MREIKFRAWDKENKEMYDVAMIDVETGEVAYTDHPTGYNADALLEQVELMQYTGLKDENGKEIYEGDLVQVLDYASWEGLYKVVWDEESLMYVLEDAYGDKEKMCEFEEYLVKGNIYENPELLECDNK